MRRLAESRSLRTGRILQGGPALFWMQWRVKMAMAGEEDGVEGDTALRRRRGYRRRPFSSLILTRTRVASAVLRHPAKNAFACRPGRGRTEYSCWPSPTSVCSPLRCHLALTALLGFRRFSLAQSRLVNPRPPVAGESPPRALSPPRYRPRARRSIRSRGGLGPHFQRAPNFSFFTVLYCYILYPRVLCVPVSSYCVTR